MSSMTLLRNVVVTVTAALLITFGLQLLYDRWQQSSTAWPRSIFPAAATAERYQLVKVGNSHSQDGIRLEDISLRSLDLSGVAQRFEFDLALLKHNRRQIDDQAIILIAVTPISFSHSNQNTLLGFQSGYYGKVSPFLIPNINWGDYIEGHWLWFTRVGYQARKKYAAQVQERVSAGEKWVEAKPEVSTVPTTPAAAPAAPTTTLKKDLPPVFMNQWLETRMAQPTNVKDHTESVNFMYQKWYHSDEFSPEYFPANRKQLQQLIDYCLRQGWRPVLVTIPISGALQQGLLDDYFQTYLYDQLQQVETHDIPYLDFSHDSRLIGDSDFFSNSDHLGGDHGPEAFTYLLLKELEAIGYINPEVNSYYTELAP